jgi:hypothetical protein
MSLRLTNLNLPVEAPDGTLGWETPEASIGRVHGHHGNFLVVVRALAYLRALGGAGLRRVAERSVLNARYLASLVSADYDPIRCPACTSSSPNHPPQAGDERTRRRRRQAARPGFQRPLPAFPLIVDRPSWWNPPKPVGALEALAVALLDSRRAGTTGRPARAHRGSTARGPAPHPPGSPRRHESRREDDVMARDRGCHRPGGRRWWERPRWLAQPVDCGQYNSGPPDGPAGLARPSVARCPPWCRTACATAHVDHSIGTDGAALISAPGLHHLQRRRAGTQNAQGGPRRRSCSHSPSAPASACPSRRPARAQHQLGRLSASAERRTAAAPRRPGSLVSGPTLDKYLAYGIFWPTC